MTKACLPKKKAPPQGRSFATRKQLRDLQIHSLINLEESSAVLTTQIVKHPRRDLANPIQSSD